MIVINNPPTLNAANQSVSSGEIVIYTLSNIFDYENDTILVTLVAPLISYVSIVGKIITIAPSINTTSGTS